MTNATSHNTTTRLAAILAAAMIVSGVSAMSLSGLMQNASANTCQQRDCVDGRMTGGGKLTPESMSRNDLGALQVTHGFELYCNINDGPNNLEVNWKDAQGKEHHFHLDSLIQRDNSIVCFDDPALKQAPPVAPFDTFEAFGVGKLDNVDGAHIYFVLRDAGEPGKDDTAHFFITDPNGDYVLKVNGKLDQGNQQAHKNN